MSGVIAYVPTVSPETRRYWTLEIVTTSVPYRVPLKLLVKVGSGAPSALVLSTAVTVSGAFAIVNVLSTFVAAE